MARRATAIDKQRDSDEGLVVVDAGEALLRRPARPKPPTPQELAKAEAIIRAYGLMGVDAMAVGVAELAVGVGRLKKLARHNSVALLAANVTDARRRPLFEPRKVVTTGGTKVGLFAVLDLPEHDKAREHVLGRVRVRLSDAEAAARQQVAALQKEGAELIVMLAPVGVPRAKELVKAVDGIHAAVVARTGMILSVPFEENGTLLLEAGRRGQNLGVAELRLGEGWSGKDDRLTDDTQRHELYREAIKEIATAKKAPKGPSRRALRKERGSRRERARRRQRRPRRTRRAALARARQLGERLAKMKRPDSSHTAIVSMVLLDKALADKAAIKGLIDASRKSWTVVRRPKRPTPRRIVR